MTHGRTRICTLLALTLGLAPIACSADSGGGSGGIGGSNAAMLRFAHLAPEVPAAGATGLDFTIVDVGSFNSIAFGQVSAYTTLNPDLYIVNATAPGAGGVPLATIAPRLEVHRRYTIIAYRDSGEVTGMTLMLVEENATGLPVDSGRLVIGHGADDSSLQALSLVVSDTADVLTVDLMFGSQTDPADLMAGEYNLRFDAVPLSLMINEGPFLVNVDPERTSILFLVDSDTVDDSIETEVYAIDPDSNGSISPLPATMP